MGQGKDGREHWLSKALLVTLLLACHLHPSSFSWLPLLSLSLPSPYCLPSSAQALAPSTPLRLGEAPPQLGSPLHTHTAPSPPPRRTDLPASALKPGCEPLGSKQVVRWGLLSWKPLQSPMEHQRRLGF